MNYANTLSGTPNITFNIPGAGVHTIQPLSALPSIVNSVVIDGYTQPGASANTLAVGENAVLQIELDGTSAGSLVTGLDLKASNSTVRGLVINRFATGIGLNSSSGNVVEGRYARRDHRGDIFAVVTLIGRGDFVDIDLGVEESRGNQQSPALPSLNQC
jgi:hypothetical protein